MWMDVATSLGTHTHTVQNRHNTHVNGHTGSVQLSSHWLSHALGYKGPGAYTLSKCSLPSAKIGAHFLQGKC